MDRQPITREGYDKLREEIRHLEEDEMPKIAEHIAAARAEGDLSENAEYHGQREAQGLLQAKINQLKSKLANCYIADKADMPKDVVAWRTGQRRDPARHAAAADRVDRNAVTWFPTLPSTTCQPKRRGLPTDLR
jgi:hypothetical protein